MTPDTASGENGDNRIVLMALGRSGRFWQGLESTVDFADGQRYLGEVLNELGRYAEAESAYRRSIALYRRLPVVANLTRD